MQKLVFALFGAALCVLATAQYDDHKLEIKHTWEEKDYKSDDKGYDGYKKNDGYGKKQEGHSSRYFSMESNKGQFIYFEKFILSFDSKFAIILFRI